MCGFMAQLVEQRTGNLSLTFIFGTTLIHVGNLEIAGHKLSSTR